MIRQCQGSWPLKVEWRRSIDCAWHGKVDGIGVAFGLSAAILMTTLIRRHRDSGCFFLIDLFLVLLGEQFQVLAWTVQNHLLLMKNSMHDHFFI